jgi:predicted esterase
MRANYLAISSMFVALAAATGGANAANVADFSDYSLQNSAGQVILPGRLFIPPEAASDPTPRPLMVFLHGGGAIGTDNLAQLSHVPDPMLDEANQRGAFLYAPQATTTWANITLVDRAMTMINRAVTDLHADANRLYAAGYSNGGGGTWNLLSRNRDKFAAAITVSAVAPAGAFNAANLLKTAIIAVHARDDATVPVARTREVISGILAAAGQTPVNYSLATSTQNLFVSNPSVEFHRLVVEGQEPGSTVNYFIGRPDLDLLYVESPGGGHTGLLGVLYEPIVYEWMFSHSRAVPEPGGMGMCLAAGCGCAARLNCKRRRGRDLVEAALLEKQQRDAGFALDLLKGASAGGLVGAPS